MKKFLAGLGILSLILALAAPALAAEGTTDVTATVTPGVVSVSVSPTTVAYGTLPLSTSDSNRSTALSGTITATNNGTVAEDLNIRGSDSTNWTLSDTPTDTGTVGANTFVHDFDNTTGDKSLNSTDYKVLATNVAASGTADFELQMNMPTSSTTSVQESTTVTVQAVAP